MTTLTPEQMRALADMEPTDDDALLSPREWIEAARTDLRAAADEVDRLRADNEHLGGELSAVTANRDHTADEFQRLRSVIANAPHAENCTIEFWRATWGDRAPKNARCSCWKKDAL